MDRHIVLDTETTGLSPQKGHRIIEIGCVELINRRKTNNHFHYYLCPDRACDPGAVKVHGITDEFLKDKPRFNEVVEAFLNFVSGAELLIHNAPFDVGFINHELSLLSTHANKRIEDFCVITDTLKLARELHPGQKNNLDILCKRYGVDNSERTVHGALLDAEILADVYLGMTGGQTSLTLDEMPSSTRAAELSQIANSITHTFTLPVIKASPEELAAHQAYMERLARNTH